MSEILVSKYISDCAKNGIDNPDAIIEVAKKDFAKIEAVLLEQQRIAAELRPKKATLIAVLRAFGAELPGKTIKKIEPIISDNTSSSDLNEHQKELVIDFCNILESKLNNKISVSARDMMEALNISIENDHVIYSMIKWLGMEGIIKRQDGFIIQGDKWNSRPKTA